MNFIHIVLAFLFISTSIALAASTSANVPSADQPKLSPINLHIDAMDKKETRHAIFRKQNKEGIMRILEAERKVIKPYSEKEREGLSVHGLNTLAISAARG